MLSKMIKGNYAIIALAIIAAALLSINLNKPFIGHHDFNGAFWGNKINLYSDPQASLRSKLDLDYTPFLPILFAFSSNLFGPSEISLRLVPLLFSILLIIFIYKIGALLYDKNVGLLAAVFAAATPMFLYFGKLPDHEPVVVALITICFYFFLKNYSKPNSKDRNLFIIFLFLALLESWPAFFFLGALFVFLISQGNKKLSTFVLPIGFASTVILFQILQIFFISGSEGIFYFLNQALFRMNLGEETKAVSQFGTTEFISLQAHRMVSYFTSILIILSAFWGFQFLWKAAKKTLKKEDLALLVLLIYPLTFVLVFRQLVFIHDYKLYHFLPFISLAAASTFYFVLDRSKSVVKKKRQQIFLLGASLIIIILTLSQRATFLNALLASSGSKDGYELGLFLKEQTKPEDKIMVLSGQFGAHFDVFTRYYSKRDIAYEDFTLDSLMKSQPQSYDWFVYIDARDTPVEVKDYLFLNYKNTIYKNYSLFKIKSD